MSRFVAYIAAILDGVFDHYYSKAYSQEGEDLLLFRLFDGQNHGFYVDVGAHHPRRFSNTNYFYKRGWSGINIEPNPDAFRLFKLCRRKDINLMIGVSENEGSLEYYMFNEPAINTFDAGIAKARLKNTSYKLIRKTKIKVMRLDNILKKHLPANRVIDFLNIDVEGYDFSVLKSNDWNMFRPRYVLVENLLKHIDGDEKHSNAVADGQYADISSAIDSDINKFMSDHGYSLFAKTCNTIVFYDKNI